MSASPAFAATPRAAGVSFSTANTARDGTGTIATLFTAGASGSKIEELRIKATADPADCTVVWFLHDGSTFYVFDEWDIANPAAGSATVASYQETRTYENLILPSGWSIRVSITVALTSGSMVATAFGGDF